MINEDWKYLSLREFNAETFQQLPKIQQAISITEAKLYTLVLNTQAQHARHHDIDIIVQENVHAELLIQCCSEDALKSSLHLVTRISLQKHASLTLYYQQNINIMSYLFHHMSVTQAQASEFNFFGMERGGKLARTDLHVKLNAAQAACHLNGLYKTKGKQVIDHHNSIEHCVEHCTSSENFRGIAEDQSRAIFNGKIVIAKDAQKSVTQQMNKNLLLSNQAEIDTKPELHIDADDVKASHGATIGYLEPEALFYLQARGIDFATAKTMLVHGFAREPFLSIKNLTIQEAFYEHC